MTAKNNDKIQINIDNDKLDIIAWLESLRWSNKANDTFDEDDEKDLVVAYYCDDDLFKLENVREKIKDKDKAEETAEAVLLTHYLIYICNKQMDFRHIFKAGGYTISALVRDFFEKRGKIKELRTEKEKADEIKALIKNHIVSAVKKNNDKYSFYLYSIIDEKKKKDKENYNKYFQYINFSGNDFKDKEYGEFGNPEVSAETILTDAKYVKFSSRNMKADVYCIYKTFLNLALAHNCSFADFIKHTIEHGKEDKPLFYLAKGFYELTYKFMPGTKNAPNDSNIEEVLLGYEKNQEELKICYAKDGFKSEDFEKSKTNGKKRIWCVARDFVYQPIFRACFKLIIGNEAETLEKFEKCLDIKNLELPGDVWNNNPKFAKCFWGNDDLGEINSSDFVRRIYDLSHGESKEEDLKFKIAKGCDEWNSKCSPKDFDVTFSFVPNMCSNDNCHLCPFAPEGISKAFTSSFCHGQKDKLCTFVLYTIGVKYNCPSPDGCALVKLMNKEA